MAIKIYKQNDAGRRKGMSIVDRSELAKRPTTKRLTTNKASTGGRNNTGRVTCRHRGGGEKRRYRLIDFSQTEKIGIPARIEALEYDPNRSCWIMLVVYADGDRRYHLAPHNVKVGEALLTAARTKVKTGNRCQIQYIPAGFPVFNIELTPGKGGQLIRSAGSSGQIVATDDKVFAQVQLPSGEIRLVPKICYGTIGQAANIDHNNVKIGKAGRSRHMGRRPTVRGKVMNPVDHPHGGGEGRNSIGMPAPKTPWGAPALGVKTRKPKRYSNDSILTRRKPGRFMAQNAK